MNSLKSEDREKWEPLYPVEFYEARCGLSKCHFMLMIKKCVPIPTLTRSVQIFR